jgi:8-oxo-dGTP pyrophosphatase MutT (NUDIX family)
MSGGRLKISDAVSAGGVVWRRNEGGDVDVVVCGRRADRFWGLPKGTPDAGETIEQTAVREVEEETGLRVRATGSLGSIDYWFVSEGRRVHKFVHHWLMEPVGGDLANHDHEFDDVEWMPLREAHAVLRYDNERRVLRRAAEALGVAL